MGKYFITLPSMGESVVEATLTNWLKEVGDKIDIDEPIVEIATDKVDSDITSEYKGILLEKKFRPKFTGSGKVIWQSPSPGTKKIPGTLCILGLN